MRRRILSIGNFAGAFVVAGALAVAGCASSGGGSQASGSGNAAPNGSTTVAVRNVGGIGSALVDSKGQTLYFADQESPSAIHCVDACLHFWQPLTVSKGVMPTAGAGVSRPLTTANRPDGSVQVVYNGKPLYIFAEDGGPGSAKGNGFKDNFNNMEFDWHAAVTTGSAPGTTNANNNGYGY